MQFKASKLKIMGLKNYESILFYFIFQDFKQTLSCTMDRETFNSMDF